MYYNPKTKPRNQRKRNNQNETTEIRGATQIEKCKRAEPLKQKENRARANERWNDEENVDLNSRSDPI